MSSNRDFYVYIDWRLDTNEPFYIGKGSNDRWCDMSNRNNHFKNIENSVPIMVEIVKDNLTEDEAHGIECYLIHELVFEYGYSIDIKNNRSSDGDWLNLVNGTWGGEGVSGHNPYENYTEEQMELTRQRMSENHADVSGENNPFFGKSHTEEFKNSLSEQRKGEGNPMYGVTYTDEQRKAIGDRQRGEKSCWFGVKGENHPRFGVKSSDETRRLISENHADVSGVNNPRAEKIGLIDIDTNTILYFDTNKQCNDYLIDLLKLNSKRIAIYNYRDKKIYKKKYLFVSLNENYEIENKDFVNNYIIINKLRIVA